MQNLQSLSHPTAQASQPAPYKGPKLDPVIVAPAALALSPLMVVNSITAKLRNQECFTTVREIDALGRSVEKREFTRGWFKKSAHLLDVLSGRYSLGGVGTTHRLTPQAQSRITKQHAMPTGLYSLVDVHKTIGLADADEAELVKQQATGSYLDYVALIAKSVLCNVFFSADKNDDSGTFKIFDLAITNDTMADAINRVVSDKPIYTTTPRTGFFINAHSVNLAQRNAAFKQQLQKSNWRFADGSGVRVASLSKGFQLKDNVNGTDMLPPLCKACAEQGKRVFLLGAAPGVAEATAEKLQAQFPDLQIAGTEHGFHGEYHDVIERINESETDVLLVAMGSPHQENWINTYKSHLRCDSVLAVGGLFDFFSGRIPRAPRWMREVGMEWLFRLYQEPVTKFTRYVVGTPEFLIRTFILKQA